MAAIEASDQTQRIFYALEGADVHKCGWLAGYYPGGGSSPVVLSAQQCESYAKEAQRRPGEEKGGITMSTPSFEQEERSIARRTPGGVEMVGVWFSYSTASGVDGKEAVSIALQKLNAEVAAQRGDRGPLGGPLCSVLQGEAAEKAQLLLAIPITYSNDENETTGTVSEPTALLLGGGESSPAALTFTPAIELGKSFADAHVLFVVPTVPFHLKFNGEDFCAAKKRAVRAQVSNRFRRQGRFWIVDGAGEKKALLSPSSCGDGAVESLLPAGQDSSALDCKEQSVATAAASSSQKTAAKSKKTSKKGKGGAKKKKKGGGGGASKLLLAQQEALSAASGLGSAEQSSRASSVKMAPARVVELCPVGSLSPTDSEVNDDNFVTLSPSSASYELLIRVQAAWYCRNGSSIADALALGLATFSYAAEDAVDQVVAPGKCVVEDCIEGQSITLTQDRVPTTLFFSPAKFYPHCILGTLLLSPSEPNEDYLLKDRARLHQTFMLPENTPLFRTCNSKALIPRLAASLDSGGRLCNVHEGLPSHVENGKQFLVDGTYEYYHYLQDRLDDNGWGCAYRSMQTICSWIRHQSYSDAAVPSHKKIQQALVAMNDKPSSFVGSSQWIGAFEISLCLDYFYGISCKIINCSSGDDIKDHARELSLHFTTNGSPVMIGGGVLAYTLLGIDWNEKTGDIRFLILDPHYIGSENLDAIQRLGWCNWKESNLFRSDAFYNLCMPQRPRMI